MKYSFVTALIFAAAPVFSQNFKARISDLSFMAGRWFVHHEWGDMEENWAEPMGDNMVCSYRCVKNGKIVFYEFIVVEQSDSVPVMKLRHFSPGNVAWEEKDKPYHYPLVQLSSSHAVFERPDKKLRMIFTRRDRDHLTVVLERENKDGKWEKDNFDYALKP
jgi:hypothetical protein